MEYFFEIQIISFQFNTIFRRIVRWSF